MTAGLFISEPPQRESADTRYCCPFCKTGLVVVMCVDDRHGVAHTEPVCPTFFELDGFAFIAACEQLTSPGGSA